MQDIRYALRTLRRQPVFTAVALLTFALGIGGTTAIFSLIYQLLLRPLPYPHADRLVFVWNTYPQMDLPKASVSIPDYLDRRTQAPSVEDAALLTGERLNLASDTRPEELRALRVTPSFFTTLERGPRLGRAFTDADAQPGADRVAMLTDALWRTRFGADPAIVGREIRLSGEPYVVVGVLPGDFELPGRDVSLLVPFAFTPEQRSDSARGNEFSQMIARLKPGASIAAFEAEMAAIVRANNERLPNRRAFVEASGFGGYAVPIRDELVGDVRAPLLILQAGVLLVLLIACANVANLLLMRLAGRQRELAIRRTLGAGRGRVVRQLLTESLLLSSAGAALGLAFGLAGVRALVALLPNELPGSVDGSLHLAVVLFTIGLAVVAGLAFGVGPAAAALRGDAAAFLKEDGGSRGTAGKSAARARAGLVVAETAIALVLLVGAGLLVKSFAALRAVNPGFSSDDVLTATMSLPDSKYGTATARGAFWQRLLEGVRSIPGVTAAGLTSSIPLSGNVSSGSYTIVGYTPGAGEPPPHGRQEVVGGEYFQAMRIPLIAGRTFDGRDGPDSPPVVVVDEYMVRRYFAGASPIGRQISRGPAGPPMTIVGVVGTIDAIDLGQPIDKERIYYPVSQLPPPMMALMVKTAVPPLSLVPQVRSIVEGLDPEQPLASIRTMDGWLSRSLDTRRVPMLLLALFGGLAVALAAVGTYGVLAFAASQRRRELGIRQALGADRRAIVALVVVQGLRTSGVGIAIGLVGALGLGQFLRSQLFGVGPRDLAVLAGAGVLLLAVSTAASYLPARRAARVDPADALREG
jgi:putative ABC transport system permease protein